MNLLRPACALFLASISCACLVHAADDEAGLHLGWLDASASPSADFFQYSNGAWLAANPIPPAYSVWGVDSQLEQQNQDFIRGLLESAVADVRVAAGSDAQKIGDFYASGMDEAAIAKAAAAPLAPELKRIEALQSRAELPALLAHLQSIGVDAAFDLGQMQDYSDSTQVIGVVAQGGLGLPDRDYYLKQDAKFRALREKYRQHITKMLALLGAKDAEAAAGAQAVLAFETRLAQASLPADAQRDPHAIYHVMDRQALQQAAPALHWPVYFEAVGHPELQRINLAMPGFFKVLSAQIENAPLQQWKTYLRWQTVHAFAPYLSQVFVEEDFHLQQALRGTKELLPRWRRVANAEDRALGFAVGRLYVEQKFPPQARQQVLDILHGIRAALHEDIESLSWMSADTRGKALDKLSLIQERIGYPDRWRDYGALQIDRGPYVLNVQRANAFEFARQLAKIGKPVDTDDWEMLPHEVNAYYDPSMNNINFPAGILQPPYFDPQASLAVNYGAIGAVIGHEITHGFDDEGSQFDGHGNLVQWWTPADRAHFDTGVKCIAEQFSAFTVDGGLHVKGKLVSGEAIADLGGLLLALRALHAAPGYKDLPVVDGMTPDQQFFLSYAHSWADQYRPERARELAVSNPHPLPIFRVNGTLADVPEFATAFALPATSPLRRAQPCVIW